MLLSPGAAKTGQFPVVVPVTYTKPFLSSSIPYIWSAPGVPKYVPFTAAVPVLLSSTTKPSHSPPELAELITPEGDMPGRSVLAVPPPTYTLSRSEEHTSELQSLRHLV